MLSHLQMSYFSLGNDIAIETADKYIYIAQIVLHFYPNI